MNPRVRLPRTFRRFCGLMVQLLQRLAIRASAGPDKLLKVNLLGGAFSGSSRLHELYPVVTESVLWQVIKGPVTKHLPAGCARIALSHSAPDVMPLRAFVEALPADGVPVVFSVGAMAHGKIDCSYADRWISISAFPLSAACCLGKITNALEWKWDIV